MKIFIYAARPFDEIEYAGIASQKYGIDFGYTEEYPSAENACLATGADAVSFTPCKMDEPLVRAFAEVGVRYFTLRSIGFDHVDMAACKKYGIRVSNTTYSPEGVANYAIMLMLASLRKLPHILKRSEVQDYSLKNKLGKDISSCTVGIVGTGRIGTTVIRHLSGFGCKLLCSDVYKNSEAEKYAKYVSLDRLLRECDVISLHAPSNSSTYHMLDEKAFEIIKPGAVVVNTARGNLIDTSALIFALENEKINAAALDVLENENGLYYYNRAGEIIGNHEMAILRTYPNVILSPHAAFYTNENVHDMISHNFESLYLFEHGEKNPLEIN